MKYVEFSRKMADFPLFSSNDLKLILRDGFNRSFLNNLENWQKKGYISQIRRGLYSLDNLKYAVDPMVLASKIYSPSYVSLETALNYYGIIPEAVFTVTSVTTRETTEFSNAFGTFLFRKIKRESFGGYRTLKNEEFGISFNLAIPEKALVDFFYLNRNILNGSHAQFEGYRFNEEFRYSKKTLFKLAESFKNKKTLFLTNKFIEFYAAG